MRSRSSPGYIQFFYLFLLIGLGALVTDSVSTALVPESKQVARANSPRPPAAQLKPIVDLDVYIPPQWRANNSGRSPAAFIPPIPAGSPNPFDACGGVKSKQNSANIQNAFGFLKDIRNDLSKTGAEQLRLMAEMRDCAQNFDACRSGRVKDETAKIKKQIEQNITRLRIYMALMENRADAHRSRVWSDEDVKGMPTFTMKTVDDAKKDGAPFKNLVLKHLVGNFEKDTLERLTDREIKLAVEMFNKDALSVMKSYRYTPNRGGDERTSRIAFFNAQIKEMQQFYKSKYAVLLGRFPTLAFYTKSIYSDTELAASLEEVRSNADAFQVATLPANARSWTDLRHLIMNVSVVEDRLEQEPENCELAHKLVLALQQADDTKTFFKKWRGWGVFGLVTACVVASGGTLAVVCGGGGVLASSAFLFDEYLVLDSEASDLITNTKSADPNKILEIWARTKKFKINVVIHVIGVATFAGIIPISTTDPLRNAIQEILKNSTEPIAAQILIERVAVKLQGVVETKIIETLVNSYTSIEKDMASDKSDLQYYHQFVKKLRKS